jgi:hypothetical protein
VLLPEAKVLLPSDCVNAPVNMARYWSRTRRVLADCPNKIQSLRDIDTPQVVDSSEVMSRNGFNAESTKKWRAVRRKESQCCCRLKSSNDSCQSTPNQSKRATEIEGVTELSRVKHTTDSPRKCRKYFESPASRRSLADVISRPRPILPSGWTYAMAGHVATNAWEHTSHTGPKRDCKE